MNIFFSRNSDLPVKFLRSLYFSLIESVILYGAEIWAVYPSQTLKNSQYILNELDKPLCKFIRRILGLPQSAPTSACLIELGITRTYGRAICRALNYWVKIIQFPQSHIMYLCLEKQKQLIERGIKPWLYHIRFLLFSLGFGHVWESGGPGHPKKFRIILKQRIDDIHSTTLFEEATNLRSLDYYTSILKTSISEPEQYTFRCLAIRRTIAVFRLNLKYTLPFEKHTDICKLCNQVISWSEHWKHFLEICESLPPIGADFSHVPYPYCIRLATGDTDHIYFKRIRFALAK